MNPRILRPFSLSLLLAFILAFLPGGVWADGVNGSLDFLYSNVSSKTTDASGNAVKTETNSFNQRYSLLVDKTIYPNLSFTAGGLFEQDLSSLKSNDTDTTSSDTKLRPFANLTLSNPLYTAGIGYARREETLGTPSVTTVNEDYDAILGWRPEGLPSFDMRYTRTNTFDTAHSIQDLTKDLLILGSKYIYKGLDVRYQANYTDSKDKLNRLETQDLTQTGRINYFDSFFNRRLSVNTSYYISRDDTTITSPGRGLVNFQIFPFAGLSAINDTPIIGALSSTPALIDGNLTVSSGLNIGGLPPLGGDTRARNVGLDFLNVTEVNSLLVWVDRELPADISNSFSWDVYTSSDNLNWALFTTIFPAPFGPFQNRFEIDFSVVSTRYIKVVTKPLAPTVLGASAFPNISITEIQAFRQKPAGEVKGTTSNTSQIYNWDSQMRLLDIPTLFYDLSYFFTRVDPSGQQRSILSNGFSVNHRFSEILSGSARIAREDGTEEEETRTAYVYNVSIATTPLKTLRNTLVFSGRTEEIGSRSTSNNTVFLYNTADLYRGINVNLNGGENFVTAETGEKQTNTIINLIANIVPHRTLTLTLDYSDIISDRSGGSQGSSSTYTHRGNLIVAYNPFSTLYLVANLEIIAEKDKGVRTTQNYGINWTPFPNGSLQFRFLYNEILRSEDKGEDRIINPGVRWKITTRSYLDLSYQWIKTESFSQTAESNVFTTELAIFF